MTAPERLVGGGAAQAAFDRLLDFSGGRADLGESHRAGGAVQGMSLPLQLAERLLLLLTVAGVLGQLSQRGLDVDRWKIDVDDIKHLRGFSPVSIFPCGAKNKRGREQVYELSGLSPSGKGADPWDSED